MGTFRFKVEVLVLVLALVIVHHIEASRSKRQAGVRLPPTTSPPPRPMTLLDLNRVCGISKNIGFRIIGGDAAALKEFPWMAAIFIGPLHKFHCGGALISEQYVLTAAHCVVDKNGQRRNTAEVAIRLGDLNLNDAKDGAKPIELLAAEFIPHRGYNASILQNDIALIKLSIKVPFTDFISPLCLPPKCNDLYVRRQGTVAGWGKVNPFGQASPELRKVSVTVNTTSECQKAYANIKFPISNYQLCTGNNEGGKGFCSGDSGGPLMLKNANSRLFSIGIVSGNNGCGKPGVLDVYTRTSAYLDWIKTTAKII